MAFLALKWDFISIINAMTCAALCYVTIVGSTNDSMHTLCLLSKICAFSDGIDEDFLEYIFRCITLPTTKFLVNVNDICLLHLAPVFSFFDRGGGHLLQPFHVF